MKPPVLVVDDSLTVRMDLEEALASAGFEPHLSANLATARVEIIRWQPALIILDVQLPDGDGLSFLRELRTNRETASIPIMMLSSEAEIRSRVEGISAGADEYIGKPYDQPQLVARARALIQAHIAPETPIAPRRRILTIDDSPTFRAEIVRMLEGAGYEVHQAASGEEGLAVAAAIRPDAVVVDGVLPGIDGATVIRRLRLDPAMQGMPCLLLTASTGAMDEMASLEAGADAHVLKTEDPGVILVRLSALLRGLPEQRASARPSLLAPKRLLAVDDSPTYLEALGAQLRDDGYDVVLAHSGEEALKLLDVQPVDCILLDLIMPGLSGTETCSRIKQVPRWRDIPLVMLTARDDRVAMIEGINAGADDYIAKSADFGILKARLRAQLRRKHFEDENRRIREQLVRQETEAQFQQLIHSNIIGIFRGRLGLPITDGNDAFLTLTGRTRADFASGSLTRETLAAPDHLPRLNEALEELRIKRSIGPIEVDVRQPSGKRMPILLGLVRLDVSDTIIGFVIDRTEQMVAAERLRVYASALEQTNRELEEARQRAEEDSRVKSRFLANMSHELRTPLNAIIGFSDLLEQEMVGPLNPKQKIYIKNVVTSGQHLLSLVNDVLDLSKVQAGRLKLVPEPISLPILLDTVLSGVRPLADVRGVVLTTALPQELPTIHVDPLRIRQVLYNLVSNAIKFTPRGGSVHLAARVDGKSLRLSCRDTGIGIKAEDLPRLFQEFEQIEPTTGGKPEGTGLGLALTKRLVEMHGGSVHVTSEPDRGSTFEVVLPMNEALHGPEDSDR